MAHTTEYYVKSQLARKKKILLKANNIANQKIRRITKRDNILYNSLFTMPVIKKFAKKYNLKSNAVIVIMVLDLYPLFTAKEAKLWGLHPIKDNMASGLKEIDEYVSSVNTGTKGAKYFLTLRGKLVVKEFNKYYDEYVKKLFKSLGCTDTEAKRRVTRVKPSKFDKPGDQLTGGQPTDNP
jgi:hypothetical protein